MTSLDPTPDLDHQLVPELLVAETDHPAPGAAPGALSVGTATEDWSGDARYFEYSRAANPVGAGITSKVPMRQFPASLHQAEGSGVSVLDLSEDLHTPWPATSPALCASFLRIQAGESYSTAAVATSQLFYVLSGAGSTDVDGQSLEWGEGDVVVLPMSASVDHHARARTVMYWVTDEPLMRYLGVSPSETRFVATRFPADRIRHELDLIEHDPRALDRNRLSVLLATAPQTQTLTVTHVLWAMFGLLPVDAVQRPHRHQSVALDLIVDCEPCCYTFVGASLDADGEIVRPTRVDWEPGGAFVTPPGLWHAHYNESGVPAHLLPVQDAGLHTYLRSLDIRFAPPRRDA
ncbi:hypothetical protein BH10ACT3_BH10ACT3_08800 [soil metagenome]